MLLAQSDQAVPSAWYAIRQTDPIILVPFFGYMIGVFVIAYVAHRYLKRGEFETEYYVGSRSFGAWVLAMSWVATMASGGSFLGYPSRVYSYGWSMAFWVSGSTVTALIGLGMVGKRINRLARQTGALTLVDLLRDRYNSHTLGACYAVVVIVVTSVYLIAQFAAGARILQSMLNTSYLMGLLIFTATVVAYTTYGGFRAVAWTDTMQGIVMIVGIVLLAPLAVLAVSRLDASRGTKTTNGLDSATHQLASRPDPMMQAKDQPTERHAYLYGPGPQKVKIKPGTDQPDPDAPFPNPWLPISMGVSFFMIRSLGAAMMPTTVSRMLAFRDTIALRRALIVLAPYILLLYGSSLISMNCAHALDLNLQPHQSDLAMPELSKRVAPLLAGLLIAAPFAAVMSTVDSALLVISASVVRDIVQKTWYPQLSERNTKLLSYAATGGAGVIVLVLSLSIKPTFLQPLVIHYVGASASALFWPGILTLYWKRATPPGVVAGMIGGSGVYILAAIFKPLDDILPMHPFMYGFPASAIFAWIFSLKSPRQTDEQVARYFGRD